MIIYRLEHEFSKKGPFSIKLKNYKDYILLFPEHIDYYRAYTCNLYEIKINNDVIKFSKATLNKIKKLGDILSNEERDNFLFGFKNKKQMNVYLNNNQLKVILKEQGYVISVYNTKNYISFPDKQVLFNVKESNFIENYDINDF